MRTLAPAAPATPFQVAVTAWTGSGRPPPFAVLVREVVGRLVPLPVLLRAEPLAEVVLADVLRAAPALPPEVRPLPLARLVVAVGRVEVERAGRPGPREAPSRDRVELPVGVAMLAG
ncbi:hypothetical protein GCM10027055_21730 [Janibacter alkaliphilus]